MKLRRNDVLEMRLSLDEGGGHYTVLGGTGENSTEFVVLLN